MTAGSSRNYGLESDVANSAIDILVWGFQIEAGSSATTYYRPAGHLYLGRPSPGLSMTWSPRGLGGTAAGSAFGQALFSAPLSFPAAGASFYVVFKRTGNPAPVASPYNILVGAYLLSTSLQIATSFGSSSGQNQWSGGGIPSQTLYYLGGQFFASGVLDPYDGNWHVLACVHDGTNGITYLDGVELARTTGTYSAFTLQQIYLNCAGSGLYGTQDYAYLLAYAAGHTPAQVTQNTDALRRVLVARGVPLSQAAPDPLTRDFMAWEGDSITSGASTGNSSWVARSHVALPNVPIARSSGITGSFVDTVNSMGRLRYMASQVSPRRRKNLVSIFLGTNDIIGSQYSYPKDVLKFKELCLAYRAVGYKVCIQTPLANDRQGLGAASSVNGTNTYNDQRDYGANPALYGTTWNKYLRDNWQDFADYFIDIGYALPDVCPVTAFFGATNFVGSGASGTIVLTGDAVTGVTVGAAGSGYTSVVPVRIFGGNGSGATATATMKVVSAAKSAGGTGYAPGDTITLAGGTSTTAAVLTVATVASGVVSTVTVATPGSYSVLPTNPASQASTSGVGTGATFTLSWGVEAVSVINPPALSTAAFQIANASVTLQGLTVITTNTVTYGVWASSWGTASGGYVTYLDAAYSDGLHPGATLHTLIANDLMIAGIADAMK